MPGEVHPPCLYRPSMSVSVVIPAFNASRTIAATLQSVQRQTLRDLEIFVVDDGSTDETRSIAEGFAKIDSRFQIISQENSGVAAARNAGLFKATRDFVAWLDADDVWHPTKVEKQVAVFRESAEPPSFVYTGYRLIDEEGVIRRNFRTLVDVSGNTFLRQLTTHHFSNVSSIMAPRTLAQQCGGHDPRLRDWGVEGAEDMLLQLKLASLGPVKCRREALVGYRMHRNNMSLDFRRAALSNLKAIDLIVEAVPDVPPWAYRLARARTVGYALHLAAQGRMGDAAALFARLFRGQPIYTLLTMGLIARWQVEEWSTGRSTHDPEVGKPFMEADPLLAPWSSHMALSKRHLARLRQIEEHWRAPAQTGGEQ